MNTQVKFYFRFCLFLFFLFINNERISAQNHTIAETISYINNLITNPNIKISFSDNNIIYKRYDNGKVRYTNAINVKNVSEVTISSYSMAVQIKCLKDTPCASFTSNGRTRSTSFLHLEMDNYSNAEKISNALRYIIDKANSSYIDNDPFSSYSSNKTTNIYDLRIGMSKNEVFKIINLKPEIELIESGYEIYRIYLKETYFLYFSNNRLTRVDRGVRSPDAIIQLRY
jgi:hypothetical protein